MPSELAKRARQWAEETFGLSWKDEIELALAAGVVKRKGLPVMKTFLSRFWTDPAYFTAMCRAGVVAVGSAITSGLIVFPVGSKIAWYAGVFATAAALLFPAGDKTPNLLKDMSPEDLQRFVESLQMVRDGKATITVLPAPKPAGE